MSRILSLFLGVACLLAFVPAQADGDRQKQEETLLQEARQALRDRRFDEADRLAGELEALKSPEARGLRDEVLNARGAEARRLLPGLEREVSSGRRQPPRTRDAQAMQASAKAAKQAEGAEGVEEPAWRQALQARLQQNLHLRFEGATFQEVRSFLAESAHLVLLVDRPALDAKPGLDEMPITLSTPEEGMSLRSVLNWVTRQVGLTWTLRDEAVLITTEEGAAEPPVSIHYDVQDLKMRIRDFPGPTLKLGSAGSGIQLDPPAEEGAEGLSEEDLVDLLKGALEEGKKAEAEAGKR